MCHIHTMCHTKCHSHTMCHTMCHIHTTCHIQCAIFILCVIQCVIFILYRLKSHPMPIFVFIIIAIGTEDRRHCICWKHVSHLYFGKGKELAKKFQQHESLWKAREWGVLLLDTPASELICQALVRLSWDCCRYNDHIVGLSPRKKCGEKNEPAPLSSSLIKSWVADGIFCSFQCGLWDIQTLTCIAHREIFSQKPAQFPYFPNPNGISAKS